MSLLARKLQPLIGQEIVVVMADNRAFRGKLVEFDDESLVLNGVVEALPNNAAGWEEPTASTGIVHKIVTWQGIFSQSDARADVVRLRDAVLRLPHVLRVWEWNRENTVAPEHVEVEASSSNRGQRISRPG